jgi:hypothetical protein
MKAYTVKFIFPTNERTPFWVQYQSVGCPVWLKKETWNVLFRKMGNEKLKLATLSVILPSSVLL